MKALIAALLTTGTLMASGTATGTLVVEGHTIALRHAYAVQVPEFFDKTKTATRLVVTDAPIADSAIQDDMELMSLAREGKLNGIQFEIGAGKSNVSLFLLTNKVPGSLSVSRTFDSSTLRVFTEARVEGTLSEEKNRMGGITYEYNFAFKTDIRRRAVTAPPTSADAAQAAKAASAQAYLAFVAAVKSGNKAKMLELASPNVRRMIDQPDFVEKLSLVQSMMPAQIQVKKATETGDNAVLVVSGQEEGKPRQGTVTMVREAGKWCLVKESWRSAE